MRCPDLPAGEGKGRNQASKGTKKGEPNLPAGEGAGTNTGKEQEQQIEKGKAGGGQVQSKEVNL